jgi:hypothetical protein
MDEPSDLASRPTRMLEAGVFLGIAIDAIRNIKVPPRQGGQRSALISIVFSVIALESFVNEMTEQAQNMSPTQPAEVSTFAQMMGDADDDHASIDFRVRLAHWIMTGKMMDRGSQPYQDFALLIWLRNDLVHTRPNKLFAYGKTTMEEVHGRLLNRFRDKNILADEYSASWTHLVRTKALAEWSARTVAAVVNEICSGTSQSDFPKDSDVPQSGVSVPYRRNLLTYDSSCASSMNVSIPSINS